MFQPSVYICIDGPVIKLIDHYEYSFIAFIKFVVDYPLDAESKVNKSYSTKMHFYIDIYSRILM